MDEPQIQYATTQDGVSIAWSATGEGLPFVIPPPALPFSHLQLEMQIPEWRHWYEHLADHMHIVRYDPRGSGLSDHNVADRTLNAEVGDLEAVIDATGLDKVALFGLFHTGPIVIEYAARHPERVSHLILWCSFARAADTRRDPQTQDALDKLLEVDWTLFTETMAHTLFGWAEGAAAHRFAEYMRASTEPDACRASWVAHSQWDVSDRLKDVKAPTLVIHRRQFPGVDIRLARELAAGIPDAKLAIVDGASLSPYVGDVEGPLRLMDDFLGVGGRSRVTHPRTTAGGSFRTIMFTDIEESTATTQRLGDAGAQQILRIHNQAVRDALHEHAGTEVKHTGDGIMASFTSATDAVSCAIDIQRAITERAGEAPMQVRIGLNAGEPVIEGNDLFGTAVQLASRVCTRAEPQQILVTDVIRQLLAGKGFLFADRGETDLRGFEDPVRLYEVRWREDARDR